MKREILFKAKRLEGNGWAVGDLIQLDNEIVIAGKDMPCSPICDLTNGNSEISIEVAKVITETVCQFTGLLDKNGNKIFEGDKCLDIERHERIVEYQYGSWSWQYYEDPEQDWEITGNIHD